MSTSTSLTQSKNVPTKEDDIKYIKEYDYEDDFEESKEDFEYSQDEYGTSDVDEYKKFYNRDYHSRIQLNIPTRPCKISSAEINRKRQQRKINHENLVSFSNNSYLFTYMHISFLISISDFTEENSIY